MRLADTPAVRLEKIPGLEAARVLLSREWDGITVELRDHPDAGVIVVTSSAGAATARAYPSGRTWGDIAWGLSIVEPVLGAASTGVRWSHDLQAGTAADRTGSRWAVAWICAGRPGFAEYGDWETACRALADRLDSMAGEPLYTGSTMEDDIARAHLRRAAADIRAAVALAELGDTVRSWQAHLQGERLVKRTAGQLGVSRKFMYRVFGREEWVPR